MDVESDTNDEQERSELEARTQRPTSPREREDDEFIPIVVERVAVHTSLVPTARVRLRKRLVEREVELPTVSLASETVTVERVPVGRVVDAMPAPRREGDVLVVPVIEERLVVEKRLVLVEEIHVRTQRVTTESAPERVTLRHEELELERLPLEGATIERDDEHGEQGGDSLERSLEENGHRADTNQRRRS